MGFDLFAPRLRLGSYGKILRRPSPGGGNTRSCLPQAVDMVSLSSSLLRLQSGWVFRDNLTMSRACAFFAAQRPQAIIKQRTALLSVTVSASV